MFLAVKGVCKAEMRHPPSASPPPMLPPHGPLCCAAQLCVAGELRAGGEHTGDLHAPTTHPLCAATQLHVVSELRATGEHTSDLHTLTSLHLRSSKDMFALKEHIANICFECFRCFSYMLQVLYFFLTETAGESPTVFSFTFQLNEKIQKNREVQGLKAQRKKKENTSYEVISPKFEVILSR
jgi:hypothetical protein